MEGEIHFTGESSMTEKQTQTTKEEARILCARLLPHTTSVQNVDLVAFALDQAEKRGYERGKKDGKNGRPLRS